MANPTTMVNDPATPAVFKVSSTEVSIIVDPLRAYTLQHDGEDSSGLISEVTCYGSTVAATDADSSEGADKFKLPPGGLVQICKGTRTLKLISPGGEITVTVFPAHHLWDQ